MNTIGNIHASPKKYPLLQFLFGREELANYTLFNKCTILFSYCDKQKLSFEEIHHMLPVGLRTGCIWSTE